MKKIGFPLSHPQRLVLDVRTGLGHSLSPVESLEVISVMGYNMEIRPKGREAIGVDES